MMFGGPQEEEDRYSKKLAMMYSKYQFKEYLGVGESSQINF